MTVFIGNYGRVELQRRAVPRLMRIGQTDGSRRTFNATAVDDNLESNFYGSFITGDYVRLEAPTGQTLTWITPNPGRTTDVYIYVDPVGAIRLYSTFAAALRGDVVDGINLITSTTAVNMNVNVSILELRHRLLASVTSYELSTNRESIDVTSLSDEFRTQYSGLMSGSGRLSCIWDYANIDLGRNTENGNYLLQLVTRTQIGGQFNAKFYLKAPNYNPSGSTGTTTDAIYYEVDAIITNAAVAFQLDSTVEVAIDFVTTGQIKLKLDTDSVPNIALGDGVLLAANAANDIVGANPTPNQ